MLDEHNQLLRSVMCIYIAFPQGEHSVYIAGTDHELLLCNYMLSTAAVEPSSKKQLYMAFC